MILEPIIWLWTHRSLVAIGALLVALPVAYGAGRWHQATLDRVEDHIAALDAEVAARKAAAAAAANIIVQQTAATKNERDARKAIEAENATLEEQARQKDAKLDEALNFTCPPQIGLPAPAPPVAAPPPLGCFHDGDELGRLRERFPSGPIRRRQHPPAADRGSNPVRPAEP